MNALWPPSLLRDTRFLSNSHDTPTLPLSGLLFCVRPLKGRERGEPMKTLIVKRMSKSETKRLVDWMQEQPPFPLSDRARSLLHLDDALERHDLRLGAAANSDENEPR